MSRQIELAENDSALVYKEDEGSIIPVFPENPKSDGTAFHGEIIYTAILYKMQNPGWVDSIVEEYIEKQIKPKVEAISEQTGLSVEELAGDCDSEACNNG